MIVSACDMARMAAGFRRVLRMDFAAGGGSIQFMTVRAGLFPLHVGFAVRFRAVSVKLLRLVTIKAFHPLFKVYISDPAVSSCKLRVNPSAVTGGAGLVFIFFLETMIGEEALIDAGNGRRIHMAVSTGGMA